MKIAPPVERATARPYYLRSLSGAHTATGSSSLWSQEKKSLQTRAVKDKKKEEKMNPSPQVAALWQRIKHIGQTLVLLNLLALFVLAGAGVSYAHSVAEPSGVRSAASADTIATDTPPPSTDGSGGSGGSQQRG